MKIIKLEGRELDMFIQEIVAAAGEDIYALRVAVEEGGVKFKINGSVWSPALGAEE